ncbi:MAG: LysM peptidoglycan-binding domain-containing protein [Thermodesulfovibrionales bacterium]|nr:LysM peptidoglycan-binding domain-containing protein [Thermodesulfovibrionales bacterium]
MKRLSVFFTFILMVFILLLSNANANTYIVKSGDSIYKIAKKFNVSPSYIKNTNNLGSDRLKPGMSLSVPESTGDSSQDRSSYGSKNPTTYTVKKGDNIKKIAKRFNLTAEELMEMNDLTADFLKIGQKLVVSNKTSATEAESTDVPYDRRTTPIISSAMLHELKELSKSDDLLNISIKDRVILFSKKLLDLPYRFGGNGAFGLDCSSYVQKVYGLVGLDLPRSAREQFRTGERIDKDELSVGDLVFFRTYASFPSHVGIYLGNNLFIHASSKTKKVTINSLESPYYLKRFIGAKRVISEEGLNIIEPPEKN